MRKTNALGYIEISKKAIADIAGNATTSCYGVVGMAHKRGKDGLIEILSPEYNSKGVGIEFEDDRIVIELFIIVENAIKISTVAENIIDTVKYRVEKQTGFKVKRISVNVVSVRL